jgi:flagellar hook-associated protein 1
MNGLGIDIARKALQSMQQAMDVTAHNIANANTEGYTRQRVIFGTTEPFPAPSFNRPMTTAVFGTGVEVKTVQRVREGYFDGQTRKENQSLGSWEVTDNTMKQLETIFNEPSTSGLQTIMGEFYNSWQELSKNPESASVRNTVIQTAQMLVTSFNQIDKKFTSLQDNVNEQIGVAVGEINDLANQLSSVNKDILKAVTYGTQPNDLLDQRDQILDKLSKYLDISTVEQETGVAKVAVNGVFIVDDFSAHELQVVRDPVNSGYYNVEWTHTDASFVYTNGSLRSLVDSRDTLVPKYRTNLDTLAESMVSKINEIHGEGYSLDGTITGLDFFSGTTAADIAISEDISGPEMIGASLTGAQGDNSNALRIAQLKNELIMEDETVSLDDYYRSLITNLGVESQTSNRMVNNSKQYLDLIETHRQSVSGVSLDEEASNMIKFQKGYQAAARLVSVMSEMLDDLINVGRY